MKKSILLIAAMVAVVFFISGCLTCEKKEYTFKIKDDKSGELTIKYINIMSTMDDTLDVSEEDFMTLINDYLMGATAENDYPDARVKDKRLFEESGVLCGELVLEFDDFTAAKLYRYKGEGPYMYCLNCALDSETLEDSNGEYGSENMPVVFWEPNLKTLRLTSIVTVPDETTSSLLTKYQEWKETQ
jgi:hypothetical protein